MSKKLDLVLIHPGNRLSIYQGLGNTLSAIETPVWAGLLATYAMQKGFTVEIIDSEADDLAPEQTAERVATLDARLTVVVVYGHQPSASSQNMGAASAITTAIKNREPDRRVMLVGGHVSSLPDRTLAEEQADWVCTGEGPITIAEMLTALGETNPDYSKVRGLMYREGPGYKRTEPAPLVEDLDREMPRMAYELLPMKKYRAHNWHTFGNLQRQPYASLYTTFGCPYKCAAGDTYVALPDRLLRFDEQPYEECAETACPDPSHSHRLGATDRRIVSQGTKKVLRLRFSNGLSLTLTPDHPMLAVQDDAIVQRQAGNFRKGDWLPVEIGQNAIRDYVILPELRAGETRGRPPAPVRIPTRLDEDVAWLAGFLVGDGCIPGNWEVSGWRKYGRARAAINFAVTDETQQPLVERLQRCFGVLPAIYAASTTTKMRHAWVHSRMVLRFFTESLGMKSGEQKLRVPRGIFNSPPSVVRAFLDGLWAADASFAQIPTLTTISETLAKECAHLIHWIGDGAVVRKYEGRGFDAKRQWRVEWHDAKCRERKIGTPCVMSRIPTARKLYKSDKSGLLWRTGKGATHSQLAKFDPTHPLLGGGRELIYTRVVSVEDAGETEVYDISHHPTHKVSMNGAYVHQCSFCCIQAPFKEGEKVLGMKATTNSYRFWSPTRVVDTLEWLQKTHGVKNVKVADEMFVLNQKHVNGICDEITRRGLDFNIWAYARVDTVRDNMVDKLKAAGFNWLAFGVESAASNVRDAVLKTFDQDDVFETIAKVRKAGIYVIANYIFGLPEDDLKSMQATLDLAMELNCEFGNFYSAMAYPGSELYQLAVRENWELPRTWSGYSQHAVDTLPLRTKYLTAGEVLAFRDKAFRTYHLSPKYLAMIEKTFGAETAKHIREMASHDLVRKYAAQPAA